MDLARSSEFAIEVFFDGDCPLCRREIRFLQRRDHRGGIRFTDISDPDFEASGLGRTHDELMARIHGRTPEGEWLEGVEVFRRMYTAIGLGPLVRVSRLPLISHFLDWSYRVFARNRLRLTGRCSSDRCG